MTLPLGEALEGKYEILEKIGEGGMGSVYKVRHRLLEEVRVIKVLRPHAAEMEDLQRRFLREARMAIKLKHPNIAQLHDFSIAADGTAFIVMEYINGVGLDAMIKASKPPSIDLALELATQALAALDYLHEHQFIHRDVSPDNLMLTTSFDGSPLAKLIDLGIAKNLDAKAPLTQTGVFLGKVRYCSPEQFSGKQGEEQMIDRGSDIYSFGVLLYEMLTGAYPFNGESFAELAGSHLFQPPHSFEETDPKDRIPKGLRKVVLKSLEKNRDERFETAAEFSSALVAFRDPDAELKTEFDNKVESTVAALPTKGDYSGPGSTQGRLNREFGLESTSAPTQAKPGTGSQTASEARQTLVKIDKALSAGKLGKAEKLLEKAAEKYGLIAPLAALRERLEGAKASTGNGGVSNQRPLRPVLIASALMLVLGAVAVAWWMISGTRTTSAGELDQAAEPAPSRLQIFTPAERWQPGTGEASALNLDELSVRGPSQAAEEEVRQVVPAQVPDNALVEPAAEKAEPEDVEPEQQAVPAEESVTPSAEAAVGKIELLQPGIGVAAPVLLDLPDAVVPSGARSPKEEVAFLLRVLVDEFGRVVTAQVESGPSFKRRLREAAVETARGATFQPASKDGQVGRMWTEVRVVFKPD